MWLHLQRKRDIQQRMQGNLPASVFVELPVTQRNPGTAGALFLRKLQITATVVDVHGNALAELA